MANNWYFAYDNAPLSEALQNKLSNLHILKNVPDGYIQSSAEVRFIKDFFTPDGYPRMGDFQKVSDVAFPYLFPAIAPWYSSASIPAVVMDMDSLYRQTACEAALAWLSNLTSEADPAYDGSMRTFHALAFQEEVQGQMHTFAFPDTRITTSAHGTAAVVLIADSYLNNSEWEKQGSVPLYARHQALFQLWCWMKYAEKCNDPIAVPETAFIVRICGNLAVDCTIRTVHFQFREAQSLIDRICKARVLEPQRGLYWKRNVEQAQTWTEKLENEAFHSDDTDLHELVVEYMKARSSRKQIERELKEVTNRMEAIAVELGSLIPKGSAQGTYDLPDGTICTVTHQKKRTRDRSISPDIVRSFFPELDHCIHATGARTTVTIEVL